MKTKLIHLADKIFGQPTILETEIELADVKMLYRAMIKAKGEGFFEEYEGYANTLIRDLQTGIEMAAALGEV